MHPHLLKDSDGANVVLKAFSGNHLNTGRMKGPVDDTTYHLGCISLSFIGGNDIVTDLHHSRLIWSAVKADATNSYLVSFVNNNAVPDKTCRVLLHGFDKKRERFQQIGSRPGIGDGYS